MTKGQRIRVLFLCTGNSARSVFAEAFLKRLGGARFEAHSAGSHPSLTGEVNPITVKVLREKFKIEPTGFRSKSWEEFKEKATEFDFVITVCDQAREACPVWPGQPIVAHWGVEDPAAFVGTPEAKERHFVTVAMLLHRRLQIFTSLPLENLDRLRIERLTEDIGKRTESDLPGLVDDAKVRGADT